MTGIERLKWIRDTHKTSLSDDDLNWLLSEVERLELAIKETSEILFKGQKPCQRFVFGSEAAHLQQAVDNALSFLYGALLESQEERS
jgi:hypothetical protein